MRHRSRHTAGPDASIAGRFRGRDNALNLIRLLLAVAVIVSHSWPIAGLEDEPAVGGLSLGGVAVGGFFAISGFLISASARDLRLPAFAWRRFLRIFPAFWVCLVVTAFVLAPVVAGDGWSVGAAARYAGANSPMVLSLTNGIGSTLETVPYPSWNGSLWTLRYELFCYALAAVIAVAPLDRHRARVVVALFVAATALSFGTVGRTGLAVDLLSLLIFFLAGAVLHAFSTRVPLTGRAAVVSFLALVGVLLVGAGPHLAPLPLAHLAIWVSVAVPRRVRGIAGRHDLSYGVYLYGFPIGQALVFLDLQRWGPAPLALLTLICVIPFAAFSWLLVERPALRLKSLVAPGRGDSRSGSSSVQDLPLGACNTARVPDECSETVDLPSPGRSTES